MLGLLRLHKLIVLKVVDRVGGAGREENGLLTRNVRYREINALL